MKCLLFTLTLCLLPFSVTVGDVIYETKDTMRTDAWMDIVIDGGAASIIDSSTISSDALSASEIGSLVWSTITPITNRDTTTHYIAGMDTVIQLHRIECDTTQIKKLIIRDTTVLEFDVSCDTVYRVEFRPVWKQKLTVRLTPAELQNLMNMIRGYSFLGSEEWAEAVWTEGDLDSAIVKALRDWWNQPAVGPTLLDNEIKEGEIRDD